MKDESQKCPFLQVIQYRHTQSKKKKHKQLFTASPNTEQVDEKEGSKHKKKKSHKEVIVEYPETEQIVDEKGNGLKSKNEKQKKSAAEEEKESAEEWGILGGNQVEGKHQSPNIDGASGTNKHKLEFWHPAPVKAVC